MLCTQIQDVCSDGVYEKAWELAMEVWTADLKHKHELRDSYKMRNYAAKQENVQCVSKHRSP